MITAASLKAYTHKDLAEMAKRRGVRGWHSMRKDQLVRALMKTARAPVSKSPRGGSVHKPKSPAAAAKTAPSRRATQVKSNPASHRNGSNGSNGSAATEANGAGKRTRVSRRIQEAHAERERQKDLSRSSQSGGKDRVVLMVRGPYWLHAVWELSRQSVLRAQAAMAEHWHTARPTLRLLEVDSGATTSTAERVARDIEIHGGVRNWFIDVMDAPKSYRVDIGYLTPGGKFYSLGRSNAVTTPRAGTPDAVDESWADVAANCEKIYALSGGYVTDGASGELQELFEERLRRPMGSPMVTRYGVGAERMLNRPNTFDFQISAEMIVHGTTKANAYVTMGGEPVKIRTDGSFSVRLDLPDRRQVLPIVAQSSDGVEQRTIVLAVERNTKVMEPVHRDNAE